MCVAVGGFEDAAGFWQPLLLTETDGTWVIGTVPLPSNAGAPDTSGGLDDFWITDVTCLPDGFCEADGVYTDTNGDAEGVLEAESDGSWNATPVTMPANWSPSPLPLDFGDGSVACWADNECAAAADYDDAAANEHTALLSEANGVWTSLDGGAGRAIP